MQIEQSLWTREEGWSFGEIEPMADAQLAFVFGSPSRLANGELLRELHARYPLAHLFGCSTAGEIHRRSVRDDSLAVTACRFDHTTVRAARVQLDQFANSRDAGIALGRALACPQLSHVLIVSDGVRVNGSELTKGLSSCIVPGVGITGGLSGDGDRFQRTLVYDGTECTSGTVAAVGLVSERLRVAYGSGGGWSAFGPQRVITRSRGNVLFELDGEPALTIYKKYLGHHANQLPSSALLFPLSIWPASGGEPIVRTILGVDEKAGSMTFAGDMPEGYSARLMKSSIDDLIDGASDAARRCASQPAARHPQLALLVSCVGRKLILRNRVDEEVDAVADELQSAAITGFYSYGEICPSDHTSATSLHNQSMTITTLSEV